MKSSALIALMLTFAALGAASASRAATITVTSLADDGGAGELRAAIVQSNTDAADDAIVFQSGLSGTITLTSSLPVISAATTIQGPGEATIAIDGAKAYRPFHVETSGGQVTISGLTIQNGSDQGDDFGGAGILQVSGNLSVSNCILSGGAAEYGGAIYIYNSTPTLDNCTFTGNSAHYAGGGIYNYGGTTTLNNCTLSGNAAGNGGGLFNSGNVMMNGCTVSDNTCLGNGGGVFNDTMATLVNCTMTGNAASLQGGALYDNSSSTTLTNCTLSGNNANAPNGAALYENQSADTMVNCLLYGDNGGPEVYVYFSASVTATFCDIESGVGSGTGVIDDGDNISADPLLGALSDNGGPTETMALGAGSPCYGAGTPTGAPADDQRGVARPNRPSIGAYDAVHNFPAGLAMISVPADYSDDTIDDVLGYASPVLAVWNPSAGSYVVTPTSPADSLAVGPGYWVRFPVNEMITAIGTPTPILVPFSISLAKGWNMIGDPFPSMVSIGAVTVTPGNGPPESFAAAVSANVVESTLFTYQAGDTAYVVVPSVSGSLTPYFGYWLFADEACTLSIPPP